MMPKKPLPPNFKEIRDRRRATVQRHANKNLLDLDKIRIKIIKLMWEHQDEPVNKKDSKRIPKMMRREVDRIIIQHGLRALGIFGAKKREKITQDTLLLIKLGDQARQVKKANPYTYSTLPEFNEKTRLMYETFARIEQEMGHSAHEFFMKDVFLLRNIVHHNIGNILGF